MLEIWKDVPEHEGKYMASDQGRVKSLDRVVMIKDGPSKKRMRGKILSNRAKAGRYPTVVLTLNGIKKTRCIHNLVVVSFMGDVELNHDIVIDHINNNKHDNRLVNLQIITARENSTKDRRSGTSKHIGVSWDSSREKWYTQISINGNDVFLGRFKNEIDASNAYQNKLKEVNSK